MKLREDDESQSEPRILLGGEIIQHNSSELVSKRNPRRLFSQITNFGVFKIIHQLALLTSRNRTY